jgi:hypothetical protein
MSGAFSGSAFELDAFQTDGAGGWPFLGEELAPVLPRKQRQPRQYTRQQLADTLAQRRVDVFDKAVWRQEFGEAFDKFLQEERTRQSFRPPDTTKEAAKYQDKPRGNSRCSICKMFVEPASCTKVMGFISENGWCRFFFPVGNRT